MLIASIRTSFILSLEMKRPISTRQDFNGVWIPNYYISIVLFFFTLFAPCPYSHLRGHDMPLISRVKDFWGIKFSSLKKKNQQKKPTHKQNFHESTRTQKMNS